MKRQVEPHPAGEEERELVRVADDDQRAELGADDVVDPRAQGGARRHLARAPRGGSYPSEDPLASSPAAIACRSVAAARQAHSATGLGAVRHDRLREARASRTRPGAARPGRRGAARPVRPISPKHATPGRTGAPRAAEAIASATPRSAPGSSIRTPPATFTKTSAWPSATPAWRPSTATIIDSRFGSTPGRRRGAASPGRWARRAPGSRAGAAACPRARRRPPSRAGSSSARPKSSRRVRDADEALRGHLEDAELVRRAEAVLDRAQDAVRRGSGRPRNGARSRPGARGRAGRRRRPPS